MQLGSRSLPDREGKKTLYRKESTEKLTTVQESNDSSFLPHSAMTNIGVRGRLYNQGDLDVCAYVSVGTGVLLGTESSAT